MYNTTLNFSVYFGWKKNCIIYGKMRLSKALLPEKSVCYLYMLGVTNRKVLSSTGEGLYLSRTVVYNVWENWCLISATQLSYILCRFASISQHREVWWRSFSCQATPKVIHSCWEFFSNHWLRTVLQAKSLGLDPKTYPMKHLRYGFYRTCRLQVLQLT